MEYECVVSKYVNRNLMYRYGVSGHMHDLIDIMLTDHRDDRFTLQFLFPVSPLTLQPSMLLGQSVETQDLLTVLLHLSFLSLAKYLTLSQQSPPGFPLIVSGLSRRINSNCSVRPGPSIMLPEIYRAL